MCTAWSDPLFRQPYIPTTLYSHNPIFRQPYIPTALYSYVEPYIPTALLYDNLCYDNSILSRGDPGGFGHYQFFFILPLLCSCDKATLLHTEKDLLCLWIAMCFYHSMQNNNMDRDRKNKQITL